MGNSKRYVHDRTRRRQGRASSWWTAAGGGALFLAFSPWPSALLIRALFAKGARATVREMAPFAPSEGVTGKFNIKYLNRKSSNGQVAGGSYRQLRGIAATSPGLDLFLPSDGAAPLPMVFWIHGGAWISGTKRDIAPYLRMLAARGYAAVGLDYSTAPGRQYPTALAQLNQALRYVTDRAGDFGLDPRRVVLAGDSAGAQLASQLAAIATNAEYARQVGIDPGIRQDQLSGVILNCGVYDLEALSRTRGLIGWGFKTALWAYAGERDWSNTRAARDMSTLHYVTRNFPPTFISGGNGDGLTSSQSMVMAKRLTELEVPVTTLFWDTEHAPALPHEYQFHLQFAEAHQALEETITFIKSVTGAAE